MIPRARSRYVVCHDKTLTRQAMSCNNKPTGPSSRRRRIGKMGNATYATVPSPPRVPTGHWQLASLKICGRNKPARDHHNTYSVRCAGRYGLPPEGQGPWILGPGPLGAWVQ